MEKKTVVVHIPKVDLPSKEELLALMATMSREAADILHTMPGVRAHQLGCRIEAARTRWLADGAKAKRAGDVLPILPHEWVAMDGHRQIEAVGRTIFAIATCSKDIGKGVNPAMTWLLLDELDDVWKRDRR